MRQLAWWPRQFSSHGKAGLGMLQPMQREAESRAGVLAGGCLPPIAPTLDCNPCHAPLHLVLGLDRGLVRQDGNVRIKLPGSLGVRLSSHQHHALANLGAGGERWGGHVTAQSRQVHRASVWATKQQYARAVPPCIQKQTCIAMPPSQTARKVLNTSPTWWRLMRLSASAAVCPATTRPTGSRL